jgi:hypothetical protein
MRSYKDFVKDDSRYLSKGLQAPDVWALNKILLRISQGGESKVCVQGTSDVWALNKVLWRLQMFEDLNKVPERLKFQ